MLKHPLAIFDENRGNLIDTFEHIFDEWFNDSFPVFRQNLGIVDLFGGGSYPKVNIVDLEDKVVIEAGVPGMDKDSVKVEVIDNILTIRGIKQESRYDQKTPYLRRELKQSSFNRSFGLGEHLDTSKVDAKFNDGLLTITLPKLIPSPKKVIRQIEIK